MLDKYKYKFYLTSSNLKELIPTDGVKKEVASTINLPAIGDRQPDLSYFSAEFVSSGTNLNMSHFLPSELVAAIDSVPSKALDIEHEESEIIGHIYSGVLVNEKRDVLDKAALASLNNSTIDANKFTIDIGAVVYNTRFPELAAEIVNGDWCVSMECYYQDFDLLVGNVIIPKTYAELIGYDLTKANIFGKNATIVKDGKEIASGKVAKVLRNILFSGCGITKKPANPTSVVFEAASVDEPELIFDINSLSSKEIATSISEIVEEPQIDNNNVTSYSIDTNSKEKLSKSLAFHIAINDLIKRCVR